MREDIRGSVAGFARIFDASEAWGGSILSRLGLNIDPAGCFNPTRGRQILERLVLITQGKRIEDLEESIVRAAMGNTEPRIREWVEGVFEQHGLSVVGHAKRKAARMTIRRPDGTKFFVMTYVAMTEKENQQIGFTTSYLGNDENIEWFVFVAHPWGRVFARKRQEIVERMRLPAGKEPKSTNVTFTRGTGTDDLLETRIQEMIDPNQDRKSKE